MEFKGYAVFYIQNVTDIDDKIINRSKESGIPSDVLARKFEKRYREDMAKLNVNGVNLFARATDHMPEILDQIQRLIDKGFAYETEDGVYFEIDTFDEFGKLSNRNVEELESHREIAETTKKNHQDFALWKKREGVDEPTWPSPWGDGRPGWHIEDTAITEYYFGPQYDAHGGGLDLIFPHHEAEITQMEAVSGKSPMVRYWLHTGFLNVNGEKMSKSLHNFITIRELLESYEPDTFRFFVLSTHYRSPIDFSKDSLHQSERSLDRIRKYYEQLDVEVGDEDFECDALAPHKEEFFNSMDDDMAERIIRKKLGELETMLNVKGIELEVDEKAFEMIKKKGINEEYGAREVERVIRNEIKPLFVDSILFGELKNGGRIKLTAGDDDFSVEVMANAKTNEYVVFCLDKTLPHMKFCIGTLPMNGRKPEEAYYMFLDEIQAVVDMKE